MKKQIEGIVSGVYVARDPVDFVSAPEEEAEVTIEGFLGDRHSGMTMKSDSRTSFYKRGTLIRNTRQVSIVSDDELAEVAAEMGIPQICAEWLGANLSIRGIPHLTALPPSTRMFFEGEAVLLITNDNLPCSGPANQIQAHYPDKEGLAPLFIKVALEKRGLVAVVERPGRIRAGTPVRVEIPGLHPYYL